MKTILVLVLLNGLLHLSGVKSNAAGYLCIDNIHKKAEFNSTQSNEISLVNDSSCSFLCIKQFNQTLVSTQFTELKVNGFEYQWV